MEYGATTGRTPTISNREAIIPKPDADHPAEQAEDHRLAQELTDDVPGSAPIALRMPISGCVLSLTPT